MGTLGTDKMAIQITIWLPRARAICLGLMLLCLFGMEHCSTAEFSDALESSWPGFETASGHRAAQRAGRRLLGRRDNAKESRDKERSVKHNAERSRKAAAEQGRSAKAERNTKAAAKAAAAAAERARKESAKKETASKAEKSAKAAAKKEKDKKEAEAEAARKAA